jgi:hypothetical protein
VRRAHNPAAMAMSSGRIDAPRTHDDRDGEELWELDAP